MTTVPWTLHVKSVKIYIRYFSFLLNNEGFPVKDASIESNMNNLCLSYCRKYIKFAAVKEQERTKQEY